MLSLLLGYAGSLLWFRPQKILVLVLVSLANGLTQGLGFFLLIPLLQLLGLDRGGGQPHQIAVILETLFRFLGLPLALWSVLLAFLALMALAAAMKYGQTVITHGIQRTFTSHLQTRFFDAVLRAQWGFVADRKSAHITHAVTQDLPMVAGGSFFFLQILSTLCLTCCFLLWAASISLPLTLAVVLGGGAMFALFRAYFAEAFKTGTRVRRAGAGMFAVLSDHLAGVKIAKSLGIEDQEFRRFKEITDQLARAGIRNLSQNARMTLGLQLMSALLLCLLVYGAVEGLAMPLAETGILVVLFARLVPLLSMLQTHTQTLFSMLPAFEATERFKVEVAQAAETLAGEETVLPLTRGIFLDQVSFAHRTTEPETAPAIRDLSLFIPARRITALWGASGVGKSTLADLVAGLHLPQAGTLRMDGIALTPDNLTSWRRVVGYVPQDPFLFNDTIRNNLLRAKSDATPREMAAALEQAGAAALIQSLPQGLDTEVRDRGSRLSGGERQRIALARALIRNPNLLILDEATNALDPESETAIFHAMTRLRHRMTLLVISHGQGPLAWADQVVCLEKVPGQQYCRVAEIRKQDSVEAAHPSQA